MSICLRSKLKATAVTGNIFRQLQVAENLSLECCKALGDLDDACAVSSWIDQAVSVS